MATNILMPALSPTMEEGKLAKWIVNEGDSVKSGDILCEIETDKATMEFEAVDEGTIGKILIADGTEGVKVNTPIAVLLEEGEDASASAPSAPPQDISSAMQSIEKAVATAAAGAPAAAVTPVPTVAAVQADNAQVTRIFASPLARRIASQKGLDLKGLAGSGPRGRIVKADVEAAKAAPTVPTTAPIAASSPAFGPVPASVPDARAFYKPDDYVEIPNDAMRKTIARRLSAAASTIPHVMITADVELDALLAVRAALNAGAPKDDGYKLSVNDFVIKAAAKALLAVPEVNASWTETAILRHKHADIGVAVALPTGLITPIVTHADEKGLKSISDDVKALVKRAKDRKLKPSEYEGGTFSVSNLGMYGVKHFTSIVNPPQGGILSVGAGTQQAVVKDGKIVVATVMTVTLALDHRIADGAAGARFLQAFKRFVEQPAAMLL